MKNEKNVSTLSLHSDREYFMLCIHSYIVLHIEYETFRFMTYYKIFTKSNKI